jgi:hypothetical protein
MLHAARCRRGSSVLYPRGYTLTGAAWRAAGIPAGAGAGAGATSSRGCVLDATEPRVASGSRHGRTLYHQSSAGFATTAAAADDDEDRLTRIKHEVRELLVEHGGGMESVAFGQVYAKRYGKELMRKKQVADSQLRAMTTEIGMELRDELSGTSARNG